MAIFFVWFGFFGGVGVFWVVFLFVFAAVCQSCVLPGIPGCALAVVWCWCGHQSRRTGLVLLFSPWAGWGRGYLIAQQLDIEDPVAAWGSYGKLITVP